MDIGLNFMETVSLKKGLDLVKNQANLKNFFWTNLDSDVALFSLLAHDQDGEMCSLYTPLDFKMFVATTKELQLLNNCICADLDVIFMCDCPDLISCTKVLYSCLTYS